MRKIIIFILCVTMILGLVACGNNNKEQINKLNSETNLNMGNENNNNNDNTNKYTDAELLQLPETPASSFKYEEVEGGIQITDYIGSDTMVIVPAQIEGKEVVTIATKAFRKSKIEVVVTGKNVSFIGGAAFEQSKVKKVIINGPVYRIGSEAFFMSAVEEINIPETVTSIGESAFNMTMLKKIEIPGSVEKIEQAAFLTSALEEVIIKEGVIEIGIAAFSYCSNLKKIHIPASVIETNSMIYGSDNVTIITPSGSAAETYAKENNIKVENP